jgi:hypothetical protein
MACNQGHTAKICFKEDIIAFSKCCALENKDVVYKLPYDDFEFSYDWLIKTCNCLPQCFHNIERSKDCNGDCMDCYQDQEITCIGLGMLNCNLDCIMCDCGTLFSGKRAAEYFYKTFEILKGHNLGLDLNLSGELFVQKEKAFKVLDSLEENDFKYIHIITNGTLLNTNDIVKLYNISKKVHLYLTFSIDSAVEETYLKIRRKSTPEMFRQLIRNVKLAKSLLKDTTINLTLIDINSTEEELKKMQKFYDDYHIKLRTTIADTPDERFHYLRRDPIVQDFIKKTSVEYRLV